MNTLEIKNTLERVLKFNKDLDDAKLRALLLASGWDSQNIEQAILIFKENSFAKDTNPEPIVRPTVEPVMEPVAKPSDINQEVKADEVLIQSGETTPDHLLDVGTNEVTPIEKKEIPKDGTFASLSLPEDLPVKPSDYASNTVTLSEHKETLDANVKKVEEKNVQMTTELKPAEQAHKKGNSIVVLASVFLLIIVLLLAYMYATARI